MITLSPGLPDRSNHQRRRRAQHRRSGVLIWPIKRSHLRDGVPINVRRICCVHALRKYCDERNDAQFCTCPTAELTADELQRARRCSVGPISLLASSTSVRRPDDGTA